jgi:hypothetical protein
VFKLGVTKGTTLQLYKSFYVVKMGFQRIYIYRFERAEISGNASLMMTRRERLGGTRSDQHFDRQRSCSMNLWANAQFPYAFLSDGFTSIVISIGIVISIVISISIGIGINISRRR